MSEWEQDAIREFDMMELRKDLAMLRVRIRCQQAAGCAEGVARLRREYQRTATRYYRMMDERGQVAA